jgi:hypothetical protein
MNPLFENGTSFIRHLRFLFMALLGGAVMSIGLMVLLSLVNPISSPLSSPAIFFIAATMALLGAVAGGKWLMDTQLKQAYQHPNLYAKLSIYRNAFIICLGLLEASAIFSGMAFYLTTHLSLLIFSLVSLLLMGRYWPEAEKLSQDIDLDRTQRNQLFNFSS